MSGRTPSFIVVGLVIIMFLLGFFYMSCSSKTTELRLSIEQFEDRIRSLTIKNSDVQKKMEEISARKHELEEEKSNVEKQMGKKDSEINDLNTKLNEKTAELEGLKSDKNVVDEQLKESQSLRDTVNEKNSLVEKLQQELQELKQSGNDELTRLKQEYETLKNNQSSQHNAALLNNNHNSERENAFPVPPGRFPPLLSKNESSGRLSDIIVDRYNKLNNLTKEVGAEIVPAVIDVKNKVLNAIGINTNSSVVADNNSRSNLEVGQNVPPPPAQIDSNIQSDNANIQENQLDGDNPRSLRSLENRNTGNEVGDEEQLDANNAQENFKPPSNLLKRNDNNNYRIGNRNQARENRNEQQLENGEEIEHDDENDDINHGVRKRNV